MELSKLLFTIPAIVPIAVTLPLSSCSNSVNGYKWVLYKEGKLNPLTPDYEKCKQTFSSQDEMLDHYMSFLVESSKNLCTEYCYWFSESPMDAQYFDVSIRAYDYNKDNKTLSIECESNAKIKYDEEYIDQYIYAKFENIRYKFNHQSIPNEWMLINAYETIENCLSDNLWKMTYLIKVNNEIELDLRNVTNSSPIDSRNMAAYFLSGMALIPVSYYLSDITL